MSPARNNLKYLITGIFLIVLGFFAFKFSEELLIIRGISPLQILGMFCLAVLTITVNGSKLNQITQSFNIRLQGREWFGLSSITTTLNNVFFKAGSLVTSNYLKRKYDFPYMSFVGSLGADQLILLFINSLLGGCVSFYLLIQIGKDLQLPGIVYGLAALILFVVMKGKVELKSKDHFIWDALIRALQGLDSILKNKKLFYTLCAHNLALLGILSLRFYVVCHILGLDIPLAYCFLFTTMVIFVSAVPMFQSDVGARELAVGFLSELVGVGFNQGLLATLIDRVIVLFYTTLLALIFKNILHDSQTNKQQA